MHRYITFLLEQYDSYSKHQSPGEVGFYTNIYWLYGMVWEKKADNEEPRTSRSGCDVSHK